MFGTALGTKIVGNYITVEISLKEGIVYIPISIDQIKNFIRFAFTFNGFVTIIITFK